MRRTFSLSVIACSLAVAACSSNATSSSSESTQRRVVSIVTTTTQLTDFARVIGGDGATVYGLLKANVDPHDFEPSPADIDAIAKADVIVKNGVGLEKWFDDTIVSAQPRGAIIDASAGVALREGDPHIWQSPTNVAIMVANIERALEEASPGAAPLFRSNLADYRAELSKLDDEDRAALATLTSKKLVTNHDAFGYYIDHYGLELVGSIIPSFDTSAELSAKDIEHIVERIKATGTKAVFSESSLPPKTAAAIAREAGVAVVAGDDALYGDSLGPAGSDGDTYLKMLAHNTRVIVDNLN